MKLITGLMLVSLGLCQSAQPADSFGLPRSTPESQGMASSALLSFLEEAETTIDALHSLMVVRHGQVVAEGWWAPYRSNAPHELYSLSKSFTSTAVGLAIAEGRLSLDDTILSFFPEDAPDSPSNHLKSMRVRDILCMSTGHQSEPPTGPDQVSAKSFLAHPVSFKPGTHFLYNTAATFMQSAIVQKTTGQTVLDYLQTRLFQPLGIIQPTWGTNFQGISLGGYGLSVRTEDIARFGQLYLQKGSWNGKQLIPAKWIETATARQTSNGSSPNSDWDQGYGFQFWRCRHGAYRGDGAFGQYCIVLPEQDAVIAITSGVRNMQAVLDLIWEKLLPSMQNKPIEGALDVQQKLKKKLAGLKLPTQKGSSSSSRSPQVLNRNFLFPTNSLRLESIAFDFAPQSGEVTLNARINGKEQKIQSSYGQWKVGRTPLGSTSERAAALSSAWTAEDTLAVKCCFYETPYILSLNFKFSGNQVFLDAEYNVSFGPTRLPQIVGMSQ